MSVSVVLCVGLLLLFTGVELGNAHPALEELDELEELELEKGDDHRNFSKRGYCAAQANNELFTYRVRIGTCDRFTAGTNEDVGIGFGGPDRNCKAPPWFLNLYNLDRPNWDDFEQGAVDVFDVTGLKVSTNNVVARVVINYYPKVLDLWCLGFVMVSTYYDNAEGRQRQVFRGDYWDWVTWGTTYLELTALM